MERLLWERPPECVWKPFSLSVTRTDYLYVGRKWTLTMRFFPQFLLSCKVFMTQREGILAFRNITRSQRVSSSSASSSRDYVKRESKACKEAACLFLVKEKKATARFRGKSRKKVENVIYSAIKSVKDQQDLCDNCCSNYYTLLYTPSSLLLVCHSILYRHERISVEF